ncbi:MAG: magnesium transporter [Defluviitaleaceae bacterium]|nr:magnesium transporter [Defluviitaleaceae bacterium]
MDNNILNIINQGSHDDLQVLFAHMNAVDIADVLEHADEEQAIAAFRRINDDTLAADVFSYLSPEKQQKIVGELTDIEVVEIMEELHVDDIVDFIEDIPEDLEKRVLDSISAEKSEQIDRILDYPEDSAGSVMTTEIVELTVDMTVREALNSIRVSGVDKETIYTCYVVDQNRKLIGVVTADTLIYAQLIEKIGDLMETSVIFAEAGDDREELANKFSKYDLLAIPVVSRNGQLVGIVTVDDILRVITEEDTEDFAKIAGVSPSDVPYLKTGVFTHARNRIIWLLILMLAATIAGAIIEIFEDALVALPILMAFVPMLMGAGGNAGAQSSTVIIRGMSLGEIAVPDLLKLIWKETRIALFCSFILGTANFIRIFLMYDQDYTLAWVVSLSLTITLVVAKTIGCMLPILAKVVKLDPAVMAAPIITTIVDVTALLVFFAIARVAFGI